MVQTLNRARTHRLSALALVACVASLTAIAVASGWGWMVQWLGALTLLPFLLADLAAADHRRAFVHVLAWASGLTLVGAVCGLAFPSALPRVWTDAAWVHDDTLAFLASGEGVVARPADYTTDHVLDYIYVSVGAAFGAVAPLLWGTRHVLLVAGEWGALVRAGGSLPVLLAGIPPWTFLGALGYTGLLVGWGEVTAAVLARRAVQWRTTVRWVGVATGVLALHLLAKVALAQGWRSWLWGG